MERPHGALSILPKNILSSGFDDLDIDIKLKGKTDPQTTIYVVVYGVKGHVSESLGSVLLL